MAVKIRCPKCQNEMLTAPKDISKAYKKCVYCGKSLKVKDYIVKVN